MDIRELVDEVNIATKLKEEELLKIGVQVVDGYEQDEQSRRHWKKNLEEWTKIALQITEPKTFPWKDASNIKFPLLSTAAMQFAARAYPTLVPSDGRLVKCRTVGSDLDGEKTKRAIRISKHMSYQILNEMEDWDEDMDKLLTILPIAGTVFKKTYYDPEKGINCSRLVMPKNLVVNYWAKSLESCERKTEIHEFSERRLQEKIRAGIYLDQKLSPPELEGHETSKSDPNSLELPNNDKTTPYIILEQHTFLDLDKDNYAEPYVVFVEKTSKKVLRIAPRFNTEGISIDDSDNIVSITPDEYYTKYSFFPNPDGGFYDIGFGRLLGPINASVDTLINQLVDAGTLSNLQSGFIGKGLRVKMGDAKFTPGEWKAVNATGQDLKQQIFPLPVREPSQVLFKLLELLAQSAKELASVAEIFVGKMPGQNTPATTTMATIEQGMKLFTAVYKRVYRSMTKEFQKIYLLNRTYLDDQIEMEILDEPLEQSDYLASENDIIPAADPSAASQQERLQKIQQVMQLLALGTINPMEVTKRMLEALEEPQLDALMMQPQPQVDPKQEELKLKAALEQQKRIHQQQMDEAKLQMEAAAEEQKMAMKAEMHRMDMAFKEQEALLKTRIANLEASTQLQTSAAQHEQQLQQQQDNHQMALKTGADKHVQGMRQGEEKFKQSMKQQKQAPKPTKK